ncbi:MAG: hypothetical protein LBU27_07315 [Candidatus Peribacteria bacterium]|nr:hypothetical protein [Candidatus Peribacteria bacterium]
MNITLRTGAIIGMMALFPLQEGIFPNVKAQDTLFQTLTVLPRDTTNNQKEKAENQQAIAKSMANALGDFFVQEVKDFTLSPKHIAILKDSLEKYFFIHPIFSVKEHQIFCTLDEQQSKAIYEHFLPILLPMVEEDASLRQQIKIKVGLALGGKKLISRDHTKASFCNKNLEAGKNTFIDDIGGAFQKVNQELEKGYNAEMMTVGDYFDLMMSIFPNPAFQNWIKTLPSSKLPLPLSKISYDEKNDLVTRH